MRPFEHVIPVHDFVQLPHPTANLRFRQLGCFRQSLRDPVDVVRIDDDGSGQLLGSTGEFAQNEYPVTPHATRHIFFCHEIHAVPQWRDQHHVRCDVEGDQLFKRHRAVKIGDGSPTRLPELPVDSPDQLLDVHAKLLVRRDVLSARHGKLHEGESPLTDRVALQEPRHRFETKIDALGVVEPIDTQDDGSSVTQLVPQSCGSCLHFWGPGHPFEFLRIDGNRRRLQMNIAIVPPEIPLAPGFRSSEPASCPSEIVCALARLKGQDIGSEQPLDDLATPRQAGKQLDGWKGNVQIEADRGVGNDHPEHRGDELELIVLDPGDVAGLERLSRHFGISLIDVHVRAPGVSVEFRSHYCIVVERPQGSVAETQIEPFELFLAERHWALLDAFMGERLGSEVCDAWPPDPRSVDLSQDRGERSHQPAGTGIPRLSVPGNRQPIGHHYDALDWSLLGSGRPDTNGDWPGPGAEKEVAERMAEHPWWQTAVTYQIYPRSFLDSTESGMGDLVGIRRKVPYLADVLGIDAVWLSPFYPSPQADFGYDVSDYTGVDPQYGTLADFDRLTEELHEHGLKLIVDFVPNHSSDQHPWFLESRSSRDNPKRDWYTWRDPGPDGGPPNNWLSAFGGVAWEFDDRTGQFYLHKFLKEQPDLNWRNPEVKASMFDALRFWMDRGVDGFRIDVAHYLMKDPELADNPLTDGAIQAHKSLGDYDTQLHINDKGHRDIHGVYRDMRTLFDEYPNRYSVGEIHIFDWPEWATYYGSDLDELHQPFNFALLNDAGNAQTLRASVDALEAVLPEGAWPNYVLGNHDEARLASRYGDAGARRAAMLLLTLRGNPTLYYGDEVGMLEAEIPPDLAQDPWGIRVPGLGRDGCRTPMQWTPDGGFSDADRTWLPMGPELAQRNVATQLEDPSSLFMLYQRLLRFRKTSNVLQVGEYHPVDQHDPAVFAYARMHDDSTLFVALNFSERVVAVESDGFAASKLVLSTDPSRLGVELPLTLQPGEGVLLA